MNLENIPAGKNIPDDIYVIIEISAQSSPIKYEINKKFNTLFVDRFISTAMFYPCNYGYVNFTLSEDGDPIDVLVISEYSLYPKCVINTRPIGVLKMIDETGKDEKIIAVPNYNLTKEYDNINNIYDLSNVLLEKIYHFFKEYKSLENGKWTKMGNWEDVKSAKKKILSSFFRAKKEKL